MLNVAKKAPPPEQTPEPEAGKFLLRPPDPALLKAIKAYSKRERRSMNMAIVMLLEQALAAHGLWPWKPPIDQD